MNNGITSGVYTIICHATGAQYIGSSWSIHARIALHMRELEQGVHDNAALSADYRQYGREGFTVEVLENCREGRRVAEQRYMDLALEKGAVLYNVKRAYSPSGEAQAKIGGVKRSHFRSGQRRELTSEQRKERQAEAARFVHQNRRKTTDKAISEAVVSLQKSGIASPTKGQIAEITGLSLRTVQRFRAARR